MQTVNRRREKGKPVERRGRKATGLMELAGLPKRPVSVMCAVTWGPSRGTTQDDPTHRTLYRSNRRRRHDSSAAAGNPGTRSDTGQDPYGRTEHREAAREFLLGMPAQCGETRDTRNAAATGTSLPQASGAEGTTDAHGTSGATPPSSGAYPAYPAASDQSHSGHLAAPTGPASAAHVGNQSPARDHDQQVGGSYDGRLLGGPR